ncbi:MAG TPA: hypothetical protein VE967_07995 [Gemmatimonadaceae bacterium]|nr:hypothetical protein [Gemmatimonadaceae bacterium]
MSDATAALREIPETRSEPDDVCDRCGSPTLVWRKCKLICTHCQAIVKSCADL